jgi:hypothetical protein
VRARAWCRRRHSDQRSRRTRSSSGREDGPFLEVEGGLPLLMCERRRAARDGTAGRAPPLLARRDPGEPWYQWGCALCEARAIWPADLEDHTAEAHPGWTARFEIVRPYPRQVLRVVYRRSAGQGPGEGGGSPPPS